ncbi:MAG: DUF997 family protein [Sutterella wadsworthensis]
MTSSNDVFPRKADPRGVPSTPTYDEALRICGREAAVTFIAALGLFAFFWGSIALFKDVHERFWGLPLWFWVAVCGGYVLSVLVVMFIVKRYFKAMPLDMVPEERAFVCR